MKVDRLINLDFLVDRWRNGDASEASDYARAHIEDSLAIPWIVKGEFLRITTIVGQNCSQVSKFLARYPTHWPDENLLLSYAQLDELLRQQSLSLGANDLWIAVSALRLDVPLVTRHTHDFGKVPKLKLDPY
jgi:predicted nucleic acid-binding protein